MEPIYTRLDLNALLATDMSVFLERAFRDLDPRTPLRLAPYVEYLVAALNEVANGGERRLIINLPPRHLKSILASIVLPAWMLGRHPSMRIAVISHNQSLARDLALKSHRLVEAGWYAGIFPHTRLATDRAGAMDFETTAGGGRYAASFETGITGRGFNLIVLDDPQSAHDAHSGAERERVKQAFDGMIASRLDNPTEGAIILAQQRLHEDDLTGHLLAKGGWRHLCLPLVAEARETYPIGTRVWIREVGDVLLPEVYNEAAIQNLRRQHGAAFFSTQFQQNPTVAHGELIQPELVGRFEVPPPTARDITFSIDTAVKVTDDASFSVVLVIASDGSRHYVVDVLRRRLDPVQMRDAVIGMIRQYGPAKILIEDASSGPGLAHMLREHGYQSEVWSTRGRNKLERLEAHLHMFVAGRVLVQADQIWTVPLLNEWAAFPNARHDDQVDAMSQYLDWWATRGTPRPVILGAGGAAERAAATLFPSARWRTAGHPMRPRPRVRPPPRHR